MNSEEVFERVQEDALGKLLSEEWFSTINCVQLRKLVITSQLEAGLVTMTERNGKSGAGIVVGMPFIEDDNPESDALQAVVVLPMHVFENPTVNLDATNGTLKSAEQIAARIEEAFRHWAVEGVTRFYPPKRPIRPNPDSDSGLVSYDVELRGQVSFPKRTRCQIPLISEVSLTVTLTNQTPGAAIYYTTDGSFPGSGNAAAQVYSTPFAVPGGTVVRWAAYKAGMLGSDTGEATIT